MRLNLAALTEGELLALFGPAETQVRLPEITRARLENRPLLGQELPTSLTSHPLPEDSARVWGATPEQSRALSSRHTELLALGAVPEGTYQLATELYARGYSLGDIALGLQWSENVRQAGEPTVRLLTWLRDRASGLACVITSNAAQPPAPTGSEEAELHLHPNATMPELLAFHRQHVQKLGRAQKLSAEQGWRGAWQAAHDLNLVAWKRRGVVVEG